MPPAPKGLAPDCAAGASLAPHSKHEVDWVVWCGPVHGRFEVELHPTKETGPVSLLGIPTVSGPGAGPPPTCARRDGEAFCRLRKSGPVTVRGSFRVAGDACTERVDVWLRAGRRLGEGIGRKPWGCPGSKPPAVPSLASIVRFYLTEHLGPGLTGDHAAAVRKARRTRQAWIDEAPVERWSAGAWGAPLDRADVEELSLRLRSTEQAAGLIEPWVHAHRLGSTYAGWFWGPEGTIYVGFTQEPDAMVERLKREEPFVAPARVKPFEVPPTHSQRELFTVQESVIEAIVELPQPMLKTYDVSIDVLANEVEISTGHVGRTRQLMAKILGPEAPIEVVKGRPGRLL